MSFFLTVSYKYLNIRISVLNKKKRGTYKFDYKDWDKNDMTDKIMTSCNLNP
jgi:hypothetical protein